MSGVKNSTAHSEWKNFINTTSGVNGNVQQNGVANIMSQSNNNLMSQSSQNLQSSQNVMSHSSKDIHNQHQ